MPMLDFQGVQWCKGMRDVQFFPIDSLEPSVPAEREGHTICCYVDALARAGITLEVEEAHERYRAFALQALMVGVVSLGLGSSCEREKTVRTLLRLDQRACLGSHYARSPTSSILARAHSDESISGR
jgi:hypothetical protein